MSCCQHYKKLISKTWVVANITKSWSLKHDLLPTLQNVALSNNWVVQDAHSTHALLQVNQDMRSNVNSVPYGSVHEKKTLQDGPASIIGWNATSAWDWPHLDDSDRKSIFRINIILRK